MERRAPSRGLNCTSPVAFCGRSRCVRRCNAAHTNVDSGFQGLLAKAIKAVDVAAGVFDGYRLALGGLGRLGMGVLEEEGDGGLTVVCLWFLVLVAG